MSLDDDSWKKKSGEEAAWIWSYADLVSLLLAFFVMMFALSQTENDSVVSETLEELSKSFRGESDTQTKEKKLSQIEREARAFRYIVETNREEADIEKLLDQVESNFSNQAKMDELVEELKKTRAIELVKEDQNQIKEKVIEFIFNTKRLFDASELALTAKGEGQLEPLVLALRNVQSLIKVEIEGVTNLDSELPSGFSASANLAAKVSDYFIKNGIDSTFLKISGKGPSNLSGKSDEEDAIEADRRVHVFVYTK